MPLGKGDCVPEGREGAAGRAEIGGLSVAGESRLWVKTGPTRPGRITSVVGKSGRNERQSRHRDAVAGFERQANFRRRPLGRASAAPPGV